MTEDNTSNSLETGSISFPLEIAQFAKGIKVGEVVLSIKNQRECFSDVICTLVNNGCKVFRVYGGALESTSSVATYLIFFEAADMTISMKELSTRIASLDLVLQVAVHENERFLADKTATPLVVLGKPALVLRCSLLMEIEQSIERAIGRKAVSILHWAGLQMGREDVGWLEDIVGRLPNEEMLQKILDVKQSLGWGVFKIEYTPKNPTKVVVRDSFESVARMNTTTEPSCHLMRGYLTGTFTTLYHKPASITESKCKSQGNLSCEFLVGID